MTAEEVAEQVKFECRMLKPDVDTAAELIAGYGRQQAERMRQACAEKAWLCTGNKAAAERWKRSMLAVPLPTED